MRNDELQDKLGDYGDHLEPKLKIWRGNREYIIDFEEVDIDVSNGELIMEVFID